MKECCQTILLTPNIIPIRYGYFNDSPYDSGNASNNPFGRYHAKYENNGTSVFEHEKGHFFIAFNVSVGLWQVFIVKELSYCKII